MRELLTLSVAEKAIPRPALVSNKGTAAVRYDSRTAAAYNRYKAVITGAAGAHLPWDWEPVAGPCELRVVVEWARPPNAAADLFWKVTKPDSQDNLMKPISDALTDAGLWKDDCQVVLAHIGEFYSSENRVTIQVNLLTEMEGSPEWMSREAAPRP